MTSPTSPAALAARLTIALSITAALALAALHLLSPEFDPSWRAVSEYAIGRYGWVLSLMFMSWGVSSWALAFAIRSQVTTTRGKIGVGLLFAAGVGEAMASLFDITHPLHGVSALIGIPSLPVAAMLISKSLLRSQEWSAARKPLLWTAHLTWISLLLMAAAFAIFLFTYQRAGGDLSAGQVTTLPAGVIAVLGWANRLLVLAYCMWVATAAWYAVKLR